MSQEENRNSFSKEMDDFQELFKEKVEKTDNRKKKEINQNSFLLMNPSNNNLPNNIHINNVESSQLNTLNNNDEHTSNGPLYDYEYKVILLNKFEEGLIDNYLSENNMNMEKPRSDPSEFFNFGLDEEKWIKFVNKSILMHYEKHLIQAKIKGESSKGNTDKKIVPSYESHYFHQQKSNLMQDYRMMNNQYIQGPLNNHFFEDRKMNK